METDPTSYETIIHKKIKEMGEKGISQQELAKSVGLPIREVSIIVKKAIKENGKSVVKLFALNNNYNIDVYVNLDSLEDIPCLNCKHLSKCGNGIHVSPQTCGKLSSWILEKALA